MNAKPFDARFDVAFAQCPLIAILRGIEPKDSETIGQTLVEAGFGIIEVPLNSPDPFDSIARLVRRFGHRAIIGAGTVTKSEEVGELARIGAAIAVSPHADASIIRMTREAGLVSIPGVLSATEAFSAIHAGANALKLFPMEMIGTKGVRALRAVLPKLTRLVAVGGVDETNMETLWKAGCSGFGLGSSLFTTGLSKDEIAAKAEAIIEHFQAISTLSYAQG